MTKRLEIRGVEKVYGSGPKRVQALSDISFTVGDCEFVSILGPSGCGKSTLLRLIAGIDHPSLGEVLEDGKRVTKPSAERTIVFQNYGLFPWLSVEENIAFGLRTRGDSRSERRERVGELAELVGLSAFRDKYPHELSGGMQQRVGLARALAPDPSIMLLDEPFGALDLLTRELMQEEMVRLQEHEQKTFVLVTHSVEEAVFLGDRVIVMTHLPGTIKEIVDISLPSPRTAELRTGSDAFHEHRRHLDALLRDEITPA